MKAAMANPERERRDRILIYAVVVAIVIVAALASFGLRRGSTLQQCLGAAITQSKYECLNQLAMATDNASICGYLPSGSANGCYGAIAEKTLNAGTCSKISGAQNQSTCVLFVANATADASDCSYMPSGSSAPCYSLLAVKQYNQTLCADIASTTGSQACDAAVQTNQALLGEDAALCDVVTNRTNATLSEMVLANLSSSGYSYDTSLSIKSVAEFAALRANQSAFSPRDVCYTLVAYAAQNTSDCSLVSNGNLGDYCAGLISKATPTGPVNYTQLLDECSQVSSQYQSICRTGTLLGEAVNTKNIAICAEFNTSESYQCYYSLAYRYKNATYCSYITNSIENSACVEGMNFNVTTGS